MLIMTYIHWIVNGNPLESYTYPEWVVEIFVRCIGQGRIEGVVIMSTGTRGARYVVFSSSGLEPNALVARGH
jgi:hypothetical protein